MKFLVAESETPDEREARRDSAGKSSGETYRATLEQIRPGCTVTIVAPADADTAPTSSAEIAAHDAVFVTGSPLHVYDDTPEVRRQLAFMRAVFASGVPSFGSCAGLQLAVVAAGGTVRAMPERLEAGIARRIVATDKGRDHPLLAGRPAVWDAPGIHGDEVETLPSDADLLATNAVTRVQAAEIRHLGGVFWGVQYHPELAMGEIAAALRRQARSLVEAGLADTKADVGSLADRLDGLHRAPDDRSLRWLLGVDDEFADEVAAVPNSGTSSRIWRCCDRMNKPPEAIDSIDRFIWSLLVAMLAAFLLISRRDPFTLDAGRAILPLIGIGILAFAWWVGHRTYRPRLTLASSAFLQMTLFTMLGVVLAYAIAARGGVLWDARLAAADRALGFDWAAVRTLLDRAPPIVWLLGVAYHSLIVQMIVAIVALSHAARVRALRITVAAAVLSGFVTILVSALFPAMGNSFDPAGYRHLWAPVAWLETGLIGGLRDGSIRVVDLGRMMGIVSFPSFHATLAAIFVWAFGRLPRLAAPAQLWAASTIVATPVFGGHYAVDVLAGLALAPPAIILAARLSQPASPRLRKRVGVVSAAGIHPDAA